MITKGEVVIEIDDELMILKNGSYFGEISLLHNTECTANVTAKKYCNFATLTKT